MRIFLLAAACSAVLALSGCSTCMREDILHGDCNWIENGG
jgi:outer membrane murein-binding lipoprotein Lpp